MSGVVARRAYYASGGVKSRLADRYFQLLGAAEIVLDVGCGTGELGAAAPAGVSVFGVDTDAGAIAKASRYEQAAVVDLDAEPLPFGAATFDAVVAKDVLEHLTDPLSTVREINRVLRPGGRVIASVIIAEPRRVWSDYTHVRGFTATSIQMLFEDAGLEVLDVWLMGGVPLANRVGFMGAVPTILRFPPARRLWASSWELLAEKKRATG